jgi:hypothetical protein
LNGPDDCQSAVYLDSKWQRLPFERAKEIAEQLQYGVAFGKTGDLHWVA